MSFHLLEDYGRGCAACHGQKVKAWVFPKLAGQSKEYIVDRLYAYQNRETVVQYEFNYVGTGRYIIR